AGRFNEGAGVVLQLGHLQADQLRIASLQITEGTGSLRDEGGDSGVALAADADLPLGRLAGAWTTVFLLPAIVDGIEVRGKDKRRSATFGTADENNMLVGQGHAWVGLLDRLIVPVLDLAQGHADVNFARQLQVGVAGQVVAQGNS